MKSLATRILTLLALMGPVSAHAQTLLNGGVLTPQQYATMKTAGTLPAGFNGPVAWPTWTDDGSTPPPPQLRGGGGNTCDCWIAPDGSYTLAMQPNDDGSSSLIPLPFSFNLYGQLYSDVYINNNGNVSFDAQYTAFSSDPFPTAGFVMVAPFWADVDTWGTGQVWYKVTPTALYVNWVGVGYFNANTDLVNTFQLIITDGNDPVIGIGKNVSFCYQDMQWTTGDASDGFNGFGGTPATVGANLGNGVDYIQFGQFDQAGAAYDGPFGANDGVNWLDDQNLVFNTSVFTNNIPPIGSGEFLCDTLEICAGTPVSMDFQFLSPEFDQITTATAYAPDFSNFTIASNTSGQTAQITGQFTPLPTETGYHVVTFEATDNGIPPQTAVYNIVVNVQVSAVMEPGDTTVCENSDPIDLYELLGGDPLPGGDWTDPNGLAHTGIFLPGEDPDGEYAYAVGSGGGCPNTGIVTVTTTALVDAGSDGDLNLCNDAASANLFNELTGQPQAGGNWTSPGGGAFDGSFDPSLDQEGDYTYTVQGNSPCPSASAVVSVVVESAVDAGEDATITLCTNAAPLNMLNALDGNPDNTGTWAPPGGGASDNNFNAATEPAGVYTYTVPAIAPCVQQISTLTIAVDPLPYAGENGELALCANAGNTNLFAQLGNDPDMGGAWIAPDGSTHSGTVEPSTSEPGLYAYVVNGPNTCSQLTDTAFVEVELHPVPIPSFTVAPDSGCMPLTVTFTNTTAAQFLGGGCAWDLGDGGLSEDCDGLVHIYTEAGWYNVRLTITSVHGCVNDTVLQGAVLVEEAPTAFFTWTPEFGTELNPTMTFSAQDPNATVFDWAIADRATSDQRQVSHTFPNLETGEYEVCLRVEDRYGCADSVCNTIDVLVPTLFIPNAFSPDGNGVNDLFHPVVSGMVPEDHEFMVFDRWGQVVYRTVDPLEGWNGGFNNGGAPLPSGVYNWRLIERPVGTSDKRDWFGTVTLLK